MRLRLIEFDALDANSFMLFSCCSSCSLGVGFIRVLSASCHPCAVFLAGRGAISFLI